MRRYTVAIGDRSWEIDVRETAADRFEVSVEGETFEATLTGDEDLPGAIVSPAIHSPGLGLPGIGRPDAAEPEERARPAVRVERATGLGAARRPAAPAARRRHGPVEVIVAPMPGVVLEVRVAVGVAVRRGDPLLVLEAMKMRNTIRSPRDGVVAAVEVEGGRPVVAGEPLVRIGDGAG